MHNADGHNYYNQQTHKRIHFNDTMLCFVLTSLNFINLSIRHKILNDLFFTWVDSHA